MPPRKVLRAVLVNGGAARLGDLEDELCVADEPVAYARQRQELLDVVKSLVDEGALELVGNDMGEVRYVYRS